MDESDFNNQLKKAVKWLAAEHYFFGELKRDIQELKISIQEIKIKDINKELKDAFHNLNYLAKSERRFNNLEQHIENALIEIKRQIIVTGTILEIEDLIKRLHLEAAQLIRDASLYGGFINEQLKAIERELSLSKINIEKIKLLIEQLEDQISDAEKWISALSSDLDHAKQVVKLKYRKRRSIDYQKIKKLISFLRTTHDPQKIISQVHLPNFTILIYGDKTLFDKVVNDFKHKSNWQYRGLGMTHEPMFSYGQVSMQIQHVDHSFMGERDKIDGYNPIIYFIFPGGTFTGSQSFLDPVIAEAHGIANVLTYILENKLTARIWGMGINYIPN